jgi:molybdenum cofactor cytidylyltransferase
VDKFSCAALVLAAGGSTRLGQPKQLLKLDGETLVRRTARMTIEAGCSPVHVALGADAERIAPELDGVAAQSIVNPEWKEGIASSIRAGVSSLAGSNPSPKNLLITVCDQPRLSVEVLRALIAAHRSSGAKITASSYAETIGVPAIFSAEMYQELLGPTRDQGAKSVIARHAKDVRIVEFPGGEIDIDTPEELARLQAEDR